MIYHKFYGPSTKKIESANVYIDLWPSLHDVIVETNWCKFYGSKYWFSVGLGLVWISSSEKILTCYIVLL
jgi:hypothetical protein